MSDRDYQAITTIAVIAALADGRRLVEETAELERIADELGGADYGATARRVLAGQLRIADVVAGLTTEESRRGAYETAVVVCHADGQPNEQEKVFLADLRVALGLDETTAGSVGQAALGLASAPLAGPAVEAPSVASRASKGPRPSQAGIPAITPDAALDELILKHAMLAGALELLPQKLATLAIVPLQARLVYRIGTDFGQKLDATQVADLGAAMGIGAAGQVLEGTVRRLLGGLAGGVLGGVAGGVAKAAAGAALTFATTYAMGQAAKQYYAQGRQLSGADLRDLFTRLKDDARALYPKVEARIAEQAKDLRLDDVLSRLRG